MVKADIVQLIRRSYVLDDIGVAVPVETSTEIPAEVRSITRSEWEAAGQQGLNAAFMLLTPECNYGGQEIAVFRGTRYGIYRTFSQTGSEMIELYLEKKAGVTDG